MRRGGDETVRRYALLVTCGGTGQRMGSATPKQFLPLGGRPILWRTLEALSRGPAFDEAAVVLPASWGGDAPVVPPDLPFPVRLVEGGPSRQASVARGLAAISEKATHVWIHDGVRPFVPTSLLERLHEACVAGHGAIVCGLPVQCTLKRVGRDGRVCGTVDREGLWEVQTPQVFRLALIRRAHAAATADGPGAPDDACLVERLGETVHCVPGATWNVKITTRDDMVLAETLYGRLRDKL